MTVPDGSTTVPDDSTEWVDAAGHGVVPAGGERWIHAGPPIRDCEVVRVLVGARCRPLTANDEFHVCIRSSARLFQFEIGGVRA